MNTRTQSNIIEKASYEFKRGNLLMAEKLAKQYKGDSPIKDDIIHRMAKIREWNIMGKPSCFTGRLPFEYFPKHLKALSLIERYFVLSPKLKMLDVGCFMGYWVLYMRRLGHHALGCDIQKDLMDQMEKKFMGFKFANAERLEDTYDMKFDVITMFDSLEHCLDDKAAVESAKNILRPGGLLIAHLPIGELYADDGFEHMRIYNEDTVKSLMGDIKIYPCIDEVGRRTMMCVWIKEK